MHSGNAHSAQSPSPGPTQASALDLSWGQGSLQLVHNVNAYELAKKQLQQKRTLEIFSSSTLLVFYFL